jgi:hypothetical protein
MTEKNNSTKLFGIKVKKLNFVKKGLEIIVDIVFRNLAQKIRKN